MKFVFTRVIAAISLLLLSAGCSDSSSFRADPQDRVKVLAPMPKADGKYKLQVFELLGIEDLKKLSGQFAQFFFSPKVVNSKLTGEAPSAQFIVNSNGEYIPTNVMTQQMSAIYFHLQKLAALDAELGVGHVNTWPRQVGMGVQVSNGIENNAFYDGATDSMLFVPYSDDDLVIALNGGIIAHEHFHSLFYKFLMAEDNPQPHSRREFLKASGISDDQESKLQDRANSRDPRRKKLTDLEKASYHQEILLRSMNEGLADYWGWMYTGDPDFILPSLQEAARNRSLAPQNAGSFRTLPRVVDVLYYLNNHNDRSDDSNFESNILALSYQLGTSYARFFKNFADVYAGARDIEDLQARKEIAKKIIDILPLIKKSFSERSAVGFYDNLDLVKNLLQVTPDLKMLECETLVPAMNHLKNPDADDYICVEKDGVVKVESKSVVAEIPATPPSDASTEVVP